MATAVHPGYMGIIDIQDIGSFRYASASVSAKQSINAPDMIMGDWDHNAYVYGKIEVGGSISGPVTETFSGANGIFNWAANRQGCGLLDPKEMDIYYYCGEGTRHRHFEGMLVNSLNFSVSAGDVANFSIDVMGSSAGQLTSTDPTPFTTAEKLITWDRCSVTIGGSGPGSSVLSSSDIAFSAFDFTISNNLEAAYAMVQDIGSQNLFPYQIVPGLRTITGTLSAYNVPDADGVDTWGELVSAEDTSDITFNIGNLNVTMRCQFHRVEPASSTGLIVSTIGFTGVAHQSGVFG